MFFQSHFLAKPMITLGTRSLMSRSDLSYYRTPAAFRGRGQSATRVKLAQIPPVSMLFENAPNDDAAENMFTIPEKYSFS